MKFTRAYIPVGGGWSSTFCRWQGALSELSSLDLAVSTTKRALVERSVPAEELTGIVLGWTVPQPEAFYGASTIAAKIGAPGSLRSAATRARQRSDPRIAGFRRRSAFAF